VRDGRISFESVVDSDALLKQLCEIPGIGKWTAQYVAMRALGEPDAFPSGDLGLLRAMALKDSRELAQHAEAWRPWRAYAAMYLWRITSQRAKSGKEPTASSTQKEALGSIPSSQHLSLVV
jgi:3-methyladenine DNA glycosylase/8-oxoguanine DNA glycosylase